MKVVVMVATLLMFAGSAMGTVYSWVDAQGTTNFTEDYGSIPKKYRKKAKVVGGDEQEPAAEPQSQKVKTRSPAAPEAQEKSAVSGGEDTKKPQFGGKDASAWKTEFARTNAELKAAEDQLAQLRGRLADTSKMSRTEYLGIQMTIKNTESHVTELRKQRDALVDAANKAMVPAEYR
jgi:hypothetical protein